MKTRNIFRAANILILVALLSACAPLATATAAKVKSTNMAQITPSAMLPFAYQSSLLNPLDTPRAYVRDACKYLRYKWNPWNSEPGTIVLIVRFAEVYRGSGSANGIEVNELKDLMKQLKAQEFEAINAKQMLSFMERNVKIPRRSVLFVRDGNYSKEDYDKYFRDYWEQWKWTIVNGWVSGDEVSQKMWEDNSLLENEGFVDHQAQGVQADTRFTDDSSKVVITRELGGSINAFADHFGKTPIAFVWNDGAFGMRPVQAARLLDYQLGFTSNARGPVMYNWVPQADQYDSARAAYIPEGAINDPLMTLPRYLPRQALDNLDTVRTIGNEANAYAQANKTAELNYYKVVCESDYGPIPSP